MTSSTPPEPSDSVRAEKRALRERARRRPSSGDHRAAQRRLLQLPELRAARRVALYAALPGEVALDRVLAELAARGVERVFPRVVDQGLEWRAVEPEALRPGFCGILEPPPVGEPIRVESIQVFVVPGLWFDREGWRLGRGRGHYDRALVGARPDAPKIGLCYAERVAERVPREIGDVRMDIVVTDRQVYRALDPEEA